ncbi:MAG: hypothetical protein QOG43_3526 [Actinomycetota bacterium]|jgi:alpha-tubulin suppressor-like RCC1 family protein/sugar lactone lactonase YvrE|nr:hypothetical protein [Actinomycetota bacterium]
MTGGRRITALVATAVLSAGLAVVTGTSGPAQAAAGAIPAAGTITRFAGGLGDGVGSNVAQDPVAITARDGRLVSVDGGFPLPAMGGPTARPGLVRTLDLATGNQTVLAGILTGGYRGDGGPATTAQLDFPTDAAIDGAGNVYITDTGNNRVRKVTPAGTITTFAGNGVAGFTGDGGAASSASIRNPSGIAVSPAGAVVFADRGNYRIRQVSPGGKITTIAGTGARPGPDVDGSPALATAIDPVKLWFDPAGNLYIAENNRPSPRKMLVDGTMTSVTGPADAPSFSGVDGAANLYWLGTRIYRTDASGTTTLVAGNGRNQLPDDPNGDGGPATEAFVHATGLAADGGNLYLLEAYDHRIRRVGPDGIIVTVAGVGLAEVSGDGGQARGARLHTTSKVVSGPTGTYIGNVYFGEIRRVDPSGVVSTIYRDGFIGMAVDDTGNVYFSHDHRVLRLRPDGSLSTVAGTGTAGYTGDGGPATLARLSGPGALAVDHAGNLYIADFGNHRIRRVDPTGVITSFVGGGRNLPTAGLTSSGQTYLGGIGDMAVDAEGSLYWTDNNPELFQFTTLRKAECGIVRDLTSWPSYSGGSLAVDAAGSVFFTVADEVRRIRPEGTLSTVAGTGVALPIDGLAATAVQLRVPSGLAVHPSGRLLLGSDDRVWQVEGITGGRAVAGTPCPTPDRPVWGTGYNALGQLGDGTTADRSALAGAHPPLTSVTALTGGVGHSLALKADGTVWAWGWNGYGQLGDGTTTQRLRPVPVPGLTGVVAVAGGAFHSLALKADGTVWAWGWNPFGELGDGTTVTRTRPTLVPGLTGVTAISAGTLHSLAVRSDGSVWAWGWNGVGQLGDGTVVDRRLPSRVPGVAGATGVAAGGLHSLAVTSDGSVWAWGWNMFGALGDGTTTERHVPGQVYGLTDATTVAAGSYHSLALRRDGTVTAWGFGNVGQLGQVSTDSSLTPVTAVGLTGAVAIAAGAFHSLALLDDGRVMAWGWNHFGQLAAGEADWDHPVEAVGLDHAAVVGAGAYHSLFAFRFPS